MVLWTSLLAIAGLASSARALIRFPCSQLVTERFDPLVTPGVVSPHLHQIIGGNAFNLTMDPSLDLPNLATCTTCRFKENKSNYWTAVMYFKHPNGSYIRVPQIENAFVGLPHGGMTVYYIQPPTNEKVTAFPKGFRMITGDPMRRSRPALDPTSPEAWSLTFRCWESKDFGDPSNSFPPGGGPYDTFELPKKKCPGGIRSNTFFPSCWDGKNTDTPDHSSHVSFMQGTVNPNAGIILMDGACPSTHPVRIPMVFLETVWDTPKFHDVWPTDGSQPLVLSMGDPTGFGHHGDYLFGWEGDALQRAMDNCVDIFGQPETCRDQGGLTLQTDEEMNSCSKSVQVEEVTEGTYLKELPGCNPVQYGPASATLIPDSQCAAVSTTIPLAIATAT
ncbi:hypothetical protein DFP72DRAFT_137343 [Ephemerocybe angulata]|uniref:DUF1996 domain-containing protein n=1 Tax=Ephemerocybe angulata TaxID=980116 RepID=A0A8H6MD49_9AGAR|nr:hypothetical protein DFP72DRAFT_137343 [Tulosesus angulatus]